MEIGFLVAIGVVLWLLFSAAGVGTTGFSRLLATGIPGRGILLQVSAVPTRTIGTGLNRFQQRAVVIDVELPGRVPYEVSASPYIPANLVRDVLPGATVEIRVDPKDPTNIMIVGPGVAFTGAAQFLAAPIQPDGRSS